MTREQRVFAIQGNRPSEIFDGIAVHLDAAVGEEFLEAVPVAGDVGELLAEPGFGRDVGELLPEPVAEGLDQGRAAFLPFGETPLRRTAADIGLDGVEFGCDLRAAAVVDFAKPTPAMRPTVRKPQRRAALAARSGQPVVAGIAVNLEDAVEAGEELFAMFTTAPGRIEVDDAGRIGSAPGAVVPGQGPQPAGLRPAAARIEHRRSRLVHEQFRGHLQVPDQPVGHRPQVERRLADLAGQRRAIQIEPRARVYLRLAVEGGVLSIFGDEHMGDRALGR